jgi:Dockerin type I domain
MKMAENSGEEQGLEAPEKLVAVLRRSQAERVFVPPAVDETILRTARKHLAPETQARFRWRPFLSWLVAATAVIVAVALVFVRFKPGGRTNPAGFAKEDINHDGRVDVLDAFAVARQLQHGAVTDVRLDVNGDGVVDERDAQVIVTEAVKLRNGGRS